ncbi:hypothetical protein Tco_0321655 [Tanacetum coccineum]
MSQEIVHIAMNSVDILDVKKSCVNDCNKCLELEAELLKKKHLIEKDVYDRLLKSYSTLEKHCLSLELTTQLNQVVFQKDNFHENQNAPTFNQLFELNELKAQSQEKDTVIRKLKDRIKSLSGKDNVENVKKDIDEIETINIELEHNSVMSDSNESGVTYTEVSNPFEGLSDIGSPRADDHEYLELPWMLEDPYVEAALQALPSPDYVPGPEEPEQAPPSPDYVLGPEHVDDEIVAEDQPYAEDASPTAQSPDYVLESDPEANPKEDDDEDSEEDPVNYPADGGEYDEDHRDDEVRSRILDTSVVESSYLLLLPRTGVGGLRTDYGFVATMDREIWRDPDRYVGYGIIDSWDEIVETLRGAPVSTNTELDRRMTAFETRVRQDTDEIYTRLDDEQSQRQLLAGLLNMLFRDRRAHEYTRHLMEIEARLSREAWRRSMEAVILTRGEAVISEMLKAYHRISAGMRELRTADRTRQQQIIQTLTVMQSLQGHVTTLQGQVTTLQGQVTALQGQELALLCVRMFPEESDKIEMYVGGLPDIAMKYCRIKSENHAKRLLKKANELMDKKVQHQLLKDRQRTKEARNLLAIECGVQGQLQRELSKV